MLQRAASNAYSWWWASHIRTKQSKWLEQSLQDMDGIVQSMLKLIEEDGDSFAKRAEMYYKRRPELIASVEEAYKQFRSLADRFDLLSKELQNANHTIATVFPEQVQFAMSEDEDGPIPKFPQNSPPQIQNDPRVPQVPKAPIKELKNIISKVSKQYREKKSAKAQHPKEKSGLTKEEALEEINKLQKDILALQTVKEFVKSSYESGVAKYWGIENQVMELQQKVSKLQDEFDMESVIEDDEARSLMAEAALKSCQEMLALLEEKQEKSSRDAKVEYERIEAACEKLQALKQKYLKELSGDEDLKEGDEGRKNLSKDVDELIREAKEFEALPEKSEESLDLSSSLTVSQLAEKIDQLVNRVISLETAVSSQTVLVNTLRSETDDLNEQIQTLEEQNEVLTDDTKILSTRVKEMEEKLNKVQDLNKSVESQNSNLQTNFARARTNLGQLSEKLTSVKSDEEVESQTNLAQLSEKPSNVNSGEEVETRANLDHLSEKPSSVKGDEEVKDRTNIDRPSEESGDAKADEKVQKTISSSPAEKEIKDNKEDLKEVGMDTQGEVKKQTRKAGSFSEWKLNEPLSNDTQGEVKKQMRKTGTFLERKLNELVSNDRPDNSSEAAEKKEELNWQQMLLNGMEDGEKILLKEYTTILRNYKDVKRKLSEVEKKERESQFDITLQMRGLKKAIQKRDEEILSLRRKLNSLGKNDDTKEDITQLSSLLLQDNVVLDVNGDANNTPQTDEETEGKLIFVDRTPSISVVEEKLRTEIDAILDENLDFWFRFSTAFHQVQKFKTEVKDLQDEISKIKEKKKPATETKSEVLPIYKHLREIQRELTVWLEQSVPLKDELKSRFASLCSIQEEITKALREGAEEDEIKFSSHQAAKLQGEILNMKQENNKVREELQAGLDHVSMIQLQIEKTLRMLNEEFGISSDQPENAQRNRVPLRSFLFGAKQKKQKNSIFACMHPHRRYQVLRAGVRLSSHTNS